MQALDGAHSPGSTINSLAIFNSPLTPLLVSGCKGGVMKLWNPETCAHLGNIQVRNFDFCGVHLLCIFNRRDSFP